MTQQEKEKMFLDLNSVLVKFWIEQGRPDKEVKIELLERMLNWYKKMGTITLDKQSKEHISEDLEEEIHSFWNKCSEFQPPFCTLEVKENGFAVIARHFANWQKEQMLKDAVEGFIFQSADYYPKQLIASYDGELGMGDKVKIVIIPEKED